MSFAKKIELSHLISVSRGAHYSPIGDRLYFVDNKNIYSTVNSTPTVIRDITGVTSQIFGDMVSQRNGFLIVPMWSSPNDLSTIDAIFLLGIASGGAAYVTLNPLQRLLITSMALTTIVIDGERGTDATKPIYVLIVTLTQYIRFSRSSKDGFGSWTSSLPQNLLRGTAGPVITYEMLPGYSIRCAYKFTSGFGELIDFQSGNTGQRLSSNGDLTMTMAAGKFKYIVDRYVCHSSSTVGMLRSTNTGVDGIIGTWSFNSSQWDQSGLVLTLLNDIATKL